MPELKKCQQCDEVFKPKSNDSPSNPNKYCSRECFNKGRLKPRIEGDCEECGEHFISKYPVTHWQYKNRISRRFCSTKCRLKNQSKDAVTLICKQCEESFTVSPSKVKYNASKYCSKKCQYAHMRGENSPLYVDGSTPEKDKIRHSEEYKQWRIAVFIRDKRKCVFCGSKEKIEADHIKPFALYPDLRLDVDNGRTLCRYHHELTPTYMNRWVSREEFEKQNHQFWSPLLSKMI